MQVCVLITVFGCCVVSGILAQDQINFDQTSSPGVSSNAPPPPPPPRSPVAPPTSGTTAVGFSVRKAVVGPSYTIVSSPFNLRFQNVLSNSFGGWQQISSEFIAPVSGGYFFTFNAISPRTNDFTLALMKNSVYQVTAYAPAGYQWGGNSVFLILQKGDSINLTLQDGEIYEHPLYEAYTTFSGFLVFAT